MTDAERTEWRAKGLRAGKTYGDDLAVQAQDCGVGDPQVQNRVAAIGTNLQAEAQRLRDLAIPEELIEEYTRAAVEGVMLRMHALKAASDADPEV